LETSARLSAVEIHSRPETQNAAHSGGGAFAFSPDQFHRVRRPSSSDSLMDIEQHDSARKCAPTLRFPMRRSLAVWITRDGPAWLVLAREHGWLFGSRVEADAEARWLSGNLGFPIRGVARSLVNIEAQP
jgi:hypothetical protein